MPNKKKRNTRSQDISRNISKEENNIKKDPGHGSLTQSMEKLRVDTELPTTSEAIPKDLELMPTQITANNKQEDKTCNAVEEEVPGLCTEYDLPNANTREQIVLVIDRVQDENYSPFIANNKAFTPLSMFKKAIEIFIKLKLRINPLHEFSIIVMGESRSQMLCSFTNDLRKLLYYLDSINECETEDSFNMNTVFDFIVNEELPVPTAPGLPPSRTLRAIIFYGRSYTIPKITMTEKITNYLNNPYFTCDILMTHEPVEISNNCNKIFEVLQNFDTKGRAYFFPVCRDVRKLHTSMGKLLSHPLQRPIQKLIKS
ncbi:BRISC and BRCA1-A complex member 1-like [Rhynchophorus ferrugineus]|uniref:BRISC and BRCA1-A complex member 1 n=1 Tax=Rhynchophorus ferrugineus TaxID=354439 RepID=A0A834HZI3_RHYFE|nr:hypothetical protein GWI33_017574 [Rhynchophorus ferrugineus]